MSQKQKTAFHTLPRDVRADRRRQAFKLLDQGVHKKEVAYFTEVGVSVIYDWIAHREALENNNYYGNKRGNPQDQRLLNDIQQQEILTAIIDTTPEEHGIAYFLWSRRAVREYISKKYTITLSLQRISDYCSSWGLSSQRPAKQAMEQDSEKVKQWIEVDYPALVIRAKKEQALIHWGDETNLNINTNYQRTYARKGHTPIARIPAKKTSYSLVSSLTNQGHFRYMSYKGGMNAKLFLVFLKRLVKDNNQKIFLILDNLRVHHAKIVQAWQKDNADNIELFFPPTIFPPRES